MKHKTTQNKGFSLVELLVSVAITAIILVGISVFFSSSFQNIFKSQQEISGNEGQFALMSLLQKKLAHVEAIVEMGNGGESVLLKNDDPRIGFTYIGRDQDYLVLKDFFIFNGQEGTVSSVDVDNIDNPAGITKLGSTYYVAAPSEDLIYVCNTATHCEGTLDLPDLDQPVDITNDGEHLYISDAGNNRILLVQDPGGANDMKVVAEDFNFPTGIDFYGNNGHYLFVADSLNNQVKRIDLDTSEIVVVAGLGNSQTCDHTAQLCDLDFPTGVMVATKNGVDSLYITDTGHGRLLRVFEPSIDLSNVQLPFELSGSTQISHIDFIFPQTAEVTSAKETDNTLNQKGKYALSNGVLSYRLTAKTTGNFIEEECEGEGEDKVCTDYFRGFYVAPEDTIFEVGNDILLAGNNIFKVNKVTAQQGWLIEVSPANSTINPPAPKEVEITNPFSGSHQFSFDMTGVQFKPGFNPIAIKVYDQDNKLNNDPLDIVYLTIPDGTLGSSEDLIEVMGAELEYPTGIGWTGSDPQVFETAQYKTDFLEFDYRSQATVTTLEFDTKNSGTLLEMVFTILKGGEKGEGDSYQTHTLNAQLES